MRTHTTAASLLRAQAERFRQFEGTQIELHEEMVKAGVKDHRELTSGGISTATLRALGHPFGRTGAGRMRGASQEARQKAGIKGSVPPLPINKQSGRLQASLTVSGPRGADRIYSVGFDPSKAPYAPYIVSPTGTSTMVPRGLSQALKKRNAARLHGQLMRARDIQARS